MSENTNRKTWLRAGSWAMYDFANTIYSFIVVTMYLPPLLEQVTGSNFLMSFSNVISMLIAGFSAPVLGALTDRSRCAKKWLIIVTLICCIFCSLIGVFISTDNGREINTFSINKQPGYFDVSNPDSPTIHLYPGKPENPELCTPEFTFTGQGVYIESERQSSGKSELDITKTKEVTYTVKAYNGDIRKYQLFITSSPIQKSANLVSEIESIPPSLIKLLAIGLSFVIANFTYQLGLMFYNSFLPTLVSKKAQGKVSGLGVALGYLGVLVVIFPADKVDLISPWLVFPFGGLMFFLFSLPMFTFVPEREPLVEGKITKDLVKKEIQNFIHLLKKLKHNKNLLNCLLANFLAVDAVNTAILFFTTFLINAVFYDLRFLEMKAATKYQMLALTISSIVMSFVFGWLADKAGSKKSFLLAALSMGVAAICGCILPAGWPFYITVTLFGGAGLAGVWTSGRKLFADITPPGKEGDYFGLYGLANKSSALGTIIFWIITYSLPEWFGFSKPTAYRIAFVFPLVTLAASLYFLRKVDMSIDTSEESEDVS